MRQSGDLEHVIAVRCYTATTPQHCLQHAAGLCSHAVKLGCVAGLLGPLCQFGSIVSSRLRSEIQVAMRQRRGVGAASAQGPAIAEGYLNGHDENS
eukprot:2108690-Amphidinium_carterae.1